MPYQNPLQNCLFCFKQVYFLPVICIAKGWEPKARVSVQLRLAFGPLDGAFQALAEEALEQKDRGDGRESRDPVRAGLSSQVEGAVGRVSARCLDS